MRSPVDPNVEMEAVELDPGLTVFRCPSSGGHYLPASAYFSWLRHQPETPTLPPGENDPIEAIDSTDVLLCPESGTVMSRFRVGHGFTFSIDRSITGGIWLDRGEWEALRQRNYHDDLHHVFTAPWQNQVRATERDERMETHFESQLGSELYDRLRALREEAESAGKISDVVAYLSLHTRSRS